MFGAPTSPLRADVLVVSHEPAIVEEMPRDHLVPQLHLRRFANKDDQLRALPRDGGRAALLSVRRACAETNFYDLELEEQYQAKFPPREVEKILSVIEGDAEGVIRKLIAHQAKDVTGEDRYNLTRFLAFQLVRGWSLREDLSELATLRARHELAVNIDPKTVRGYLRERGDKHDAAAVDSFMEAVLSGGWRMKPSGSMAVQVMCALGLQLMPLLWERRIRVLVFEEPILLTSDQPAALWARPKRDLETNPLGIATADAIWMPLDRHHALALLRTGKEEIAPSSTARAHQVNQAVASGARRWVFQHPDQPEFDVSSLPKRAPYRAEPVSAIEEGEDLRVLYRTVRGG